MQLAYFARYSDLHFTPDTIGDLAFNGVASNVQRQSFVNGVQGDGSYRFNDINTSAGWLFHKWGADAGHQLIARAAYSSSCHVLP